MPRTLVPAIERFASKVDVRTVDECWLWVAGLSGTGYGSFSRGGRGSNVAAHVFAFEVFYGEVSDAFNVLHTCDVRACCNPYHLYLGSQVDNMGDREARGRVNHARGIHNHAKLTEACVVRIRSLYATGKFTYQDLGNIFGVSHTTARLIVQRFKWVHVE